MQVKALDTASLIKLCREDKDNHAAWEEFQSRFFEKIKCYISRSCIQMRKESLHLSSQISLVPQQEVDDLVQEVLLRMLEKDCSLLKCFSGKTEEEFSAYLCLLSRCVAQKYYRALRRKKRPQIDSSLDAFKEAGASRWQGELGAAQIGNEVEESFFRKELLKQLYARVRARYSSQTDSEKAVRILDLYFFKGFTVREISKCQDISLSRSSVSRLISTWKRDLNQFLKAFDSKAGRFMAVAHKSCAKSARPSADQGLR